jgi:sigma54-dependent transcription regulator
LFQSASALFALSAYPRTPSLTAVIGAASGTIWPTWQFSQYCDLFSRSDHRRPDRSCGSLSFALSPAASWAGYFRDLNAAVARMATLAPGGRISTQVVDEETSRLSSAWHKPDTSQQGDELEQLLTPEQLKEVDVFDRAQLAFVIGVCRRSRSLSEARRTLFGASRTRKSLSNDADRLRKYRARFALEFCRIHPPALSNLVTH